MLILITIRDYLKQEQLTPKQLAKQLGISFNTLEKAMNGLVVSWAIAQKFKEYNIQVVYRKANGTISVLSHSTVESTNLIKYYHIKALREFGNTIIKEIQSPKLIEEEFKKLGLNVKIKDSTFKDTIGIPHYVVELVDKSI